MQEIISSAIHNLGLVIEYLGVLIVAIAIFIALFNLLSGKITRAKIRAELAKNIIFGLEFVIAADILLVTVANDLNEILQLGGIVLIRILLGYSLRKEII